MAAEAFFTRIPPSEQNYLSYLLEPIDHWGQYENRQAETSGSDKNRGTFSYNVLVGPVDAGRRTGIVDQLLGLQVRAGPSADPALPE